MSERLKEFTPGWEAVDEAATRALSISFDGCHKIYLAMDQEQADWFLENYENTWVDPPEELQARLREWYEASCGLRFISAVYTDHDDPNAGYDQLIPQFFGQDGSEA